MSRECDAGAFCLQKPQCEHRCHLTNAVLEPETRKVKAWPVIPDDIDRAPESWHTIGAFMLWCIFVVLAVICLALFFTGLWIWSLLI